MQYCANADKKKYKYNQKVYFYHNIILSARSSTDQILANIENILP